MQIVPILCLLPLIIPNTYAAVTFRLEAESVAGKHMIHDRSQASQLRTVHVNDTTERISFPFCLDRHFSDVNISVTYSNDGAEDVVRVDVDDRQTLTFRSVAVFNMGQNWNVFRSASFQNVALSRGYHMLTLVFESLDAGGIEIDYVNVSMNNDFLTEDVFRCRLVLGAEPQFSPVSGVSAGYVKQKSNLTTCPEENNVHLPVYHPSVQQYTLTATNPLYRTWYDFKTSDDRNCTFLDPILWRFEDVALNVTEDTWQPTAPEPNRNEAQVVGVLLDPASSQSAKDVYRVMYKVTFNLKGFKEGFIDADIHTDMKAVFCRNASPSSSPNSSVSMSYVNRQGQEVTLDTFDLPAQRVTKTWALGEMTWSEDHRNTLTVNVTEKDVTLCTLELSRGYTAPDTTVQIYSSDSVILEGIRSSFWWRRPVRENLTVTVGDATFKNLSRVALYVPAPWTGERSYHQVMVLYQDGNVRLVPLPASSPNNRWTPFGTSVIVGRSRPTDRRPAASIKTMTFYPNTLQMGLTYYDGSSCKLTLTYSMFETKLRVTDLHFPASTTTPRTTLTSLDLPFATFRSMFVAFGNTNSDSVQSDQEGPEYVLGEWENLYGREFLVYRAVESHHLTQSPDLRLTIEA